MLNAGTMLNKFSHASLPYFDLPNVSVLGILGADAISFANSQFMNDVTLLRDGEWQWNGWLNTKGRVLCLFALVRISEQELLVVLPDYPAAELGKALSQLVFRAKVQLGVWTELYASGAIAPFQFTAPNAIAGDFAERDIALDMGSEEFPRVMRLSLSKAGSDASLESTWRADDLRFGLPRMDPSATHAWTPQQLSLQNLRAFSVKKGCYPGQEIVARTHFLGKSKRDLILLRDAQPLEDAVSSAQVDGQTWQLAVVAMDAELPPEAVGFRAGLAR